MELVYVEWEDASDVDASLGWVNREDARAPELHIFHHAGFVCDIDPWALTLTAAYSDNQMAPRIRIPIGMIRRFVYLDPDSGQAEDV